MKNTVAALALLLSACASAPLSECIPPEFTRENPGSSKSTAPGEEEYARCKAAEAEARLDEKVRKDAEEARKKEAERLERELREAQEQGRDEPK